MRPTWAVVLFLITIFFVPRAAGQDIERHPTPGQIYCSGLLTSERVPREVLLITGEDANVRIVFDQGDYVYISRGARQGVHAGDEFSVIRAIKDPMAVNWYHHQDQEIASLGSVWEDEGRLRVVKTLTDISIAQVTESCDYMQRGDIVVPFAERPSPLIKPATHFDRFAPPSGGPEGKVLMAKSYQMTLGTNDIAYINLGSGQGIHPGDYLRFVHYQGRDSTVAYETSRMAFSVEGFGSAPGNYTWRNIPREVLGEGVVLRTGPDSASVLITFSLREIYVGDYAEIEKQ
jgi:hypothetical protein